MRSVLTATYAIVREGRDADQLAELDETLGFEIDDDDDEGEQDQQSRVTLLREYGDVAEVA